MAITDYKYTQLWASIISIHLFHYTCVNWHIEAIKILLLFIYIFKEIFIHC